jgi:hypothetical protein
LQIWKENPNLEIIDLKIKAKIRVIN